MVSKKLEKLGEATEDLFMKGLDNEESARFYTFNLGNALSDFLDYGRIFRRQSDLTNWCYNPVNQVRKLHESYGMKDRFLIGLGTGFLLQFVIAGGPISLIFRRLFFCTYVACPEFYSIWYK